MLSGGSLFRPLVLDTVVLQDLLELGLGGVLAHVEHRHLRRWIHGRVVVHDDIEPTRFSVHKQTRRGKQGR